MYFFLKVNVGMGLKAQSLKKEQPRSTLVGDWVLVKTILIPPKSLVQSFSILKVMNIPKYAYKYSHDISTKSQKVMNFMIPLEAHLTHRNLRLKKNLSRCTPAGAKKFLPGCRTAHPVMHQVMAWHGGYTLW